jgi:allantoin racemase
MHIRIINPNTTTDFTARSLELGQQIAATGTTISATQPAAGTPSVECHVEEAIATVGVIQEVMAGERDGVDGYVIACFGDTGVHAAREVAAGPVVGMTEAALYAAAMVAARFSIITLPSRTRIQSERVVREAGLEHRCARIRAVDVTVLESTDDRLLPLFLSEARAAMAEEHAEAIILGCAGLMPLVAPLTELLGIPVIEGVSAGVKMVEGLIRLGLKTSKSSSFAYPPAKAANAVFLDVFGGRPHQ